MTKKKVKRKVKGPVLKVVSIMLIMVSIYLLAGVVLDIKSAITLKQKATVVAEELEKLKNENAELISQKAKLEDPNYVQSYARGNYMFSKEGEQIFYLPSDNKEEKTENKQNVENQKEVNPDKENVSTDQNITNSEEPKTE